MRDFSFVFDHVYRSVFNLIVRARNVLLALFHFTSPSVHHGWYVTPMTFLLPDEEESDGDMNVGGPGRSSGCGVDGNTHMFGLGR